MQQNNSRCPFSHTQSNAEPKCPIIGEDKDFDEAYLTSGQFDAFDLPYQIDPAMALKWSRDNRPIFYSEKMGYWIVTRYDDIKTVFRDPVLFSARNALERITPPTPEALEVLKGYNYNINRTLVNEDEPDHMERRRLLMDHFLPENLADKEQMVRQLTEEKVDAFIDSGRVDLIEVLLYEVPLLVALHFLGVPEDEIEKLKTFSVAHAVNIWGKPTDQQQIDIAHDVGRFWQYAGEVIEKMRAQPDGKGWMHHTIRMNAKRPDIVPDSYVHSMMMAIIVAAHETTSLASANMFRTLLTRRDAWEAICANPKLIPNAVEECLRYAGSIVAWRRETTAPTTLAGVELPEGAKILVVQASGNRDERHFENGDDFDIYRDNTTEHLTFGYGAHQCLGKNIGRMEMRIFLETLTRRLPHMRLAEQEFVYTASMSFRGPHQVWVEWDPALNPERKDARVKAQHISFPIGAPQNKHIARQVKVVRTHKETDDILTVTLADASGKALPPWSPGAHIELISEDFNRKYSLCGPAESGDYQIAILKEENGRGGAIYFHDNLTKGVALQIRGPRNAFHLDKTCDDFLLIAGGIGITPIIAMADYLKRAGKSYHIHYAGRSRAHMAYLTRLDQDHAGHISVYAKDEGQRMQLASLGERLGKDRATKTQIYACGPARMLEELQVLAKDWPDNSLFYEHFSATNTVLDPDNEHAFEVELLDSGVTITVRNDQTLLDALESAGIDVASDCLEGLCGSCEVLVSDGAIEHRDAVLTETERQANNRMMACCSRAKKGAKLKLNL